ncbi:MAG: DUF4330 domain-containing protein [Oscillospiraceae bacterium]|jgi:hypothetical protein|nr:DUF4330 domain-containing protein [Oscillospiraceae bacterium]
MESSAKKRRWRLNVFDVVIICLAAAAAVVFLKATSSGAGTLISAGKPVTVRYTIELNNMLTPSAELVKAGDKLVDKIEKYALGTVVSAEIGPYVASSKDSVTGSYILTEYLGRQMATILVEAQATETDSAFSVGGFEIRAGQLVNVTGPGYAGIGYVISVERD